MVHLNEKQNFFGYVFSNSLTDIFWWSILASHWLKFCYGNSILYQKRNESDKKSNLMMKNNKKMPKKHI